MTGLLSSVTEGPVGSSQFGGVFNGQDKGDIVRAILPQISSQAKFHDAVTMPPWFGRSLLDIAISFIAISGHRIVFGVPRN